VKGVLVSIDARIIQDKKEKTDLLKIRVSDVGIYPGRINM
jgi:hypothetical protein